MGAAPLGGVVNVNKLVLQIELLCDMCSDRRGTVTLGGMVAASQIGHAALPRKVHLRFGYFTSDEGLCAGSNGSRAGEDQAGRRRR